MRVRMGVLAGCLLASAMSRAQDVPAAPVAPPVQDPALAPSPEQGAEPPAPPAVAPPAPAAQIAPGPPPEPPVVAEPPAEPAAEPAPEPTGPSDAVDASIALDTDELADDQDETEDDKPEVPWMAGLTWGHSYNAAGVTQGHEQTYNPTYAWTFSLMGGYHFDELTTLELTQPLAIELTDSDTTSTRQELLLLDTSLDLSRTLLELEPQPKQSFDLSASGRLLFPTSLASQARTTVLGTRAMLQATYGFKQVLSGLAFNLSGSYLHRFNRSNTVETDTSFPCLRAGSDVSESCTHLGGLSVTRDLFAVALAGVLGLTDKLDLTLAGSLGWNRGSGFEAASVDTDTGPVRVADASPSHFRNTRVVSLALAYEFTDWFSAQAGFENEFPEIANGERRGPLHAVDTELTLELTVSFDELYVSTR